MTAYGEVIGDPIEQSQSPAVYGFWLKALKIDADYRRTLVTRAELPDYLARRRADGPGPATPCRVRFTVDIQPDFAARTTVGSTAGRKGTQPGLAH